MTAFLLFLPLLNSQPLPSKHYSFSRGFPFNRGWTVFGYLFALSPINIIVLKIFDKLLLLLFIISSIKYWKLLQSFSFCKHERNLELLWIPAHTFLIGRLFKVMRKLSGHLVERHCTLHRTSLIDVWYISFCISCNRVFVILSQLNEKGEAFGEGKSSY